MVGEPEDGRPLRRVVAADALEHAGAVVEAVRADVDARVVPVDELAVHPDLLGGLHVASFAGSTNFSDGATRSAVRASVRRCEVGGRERGHVRGRARRRSRPSPCWSRCRSITTADRPRRERRDGARLEARRREHLLRAARPARSAAPTAAATFASSARRSPGTSASTYSPSQTKTSDLTICSSRQPTARAASSRGRRSLGELLRSSASTAGARENDETRCTGSGHMARRRLRRERRGSNASNARCTATPRSMSAPSSVSDSSTAASATAMSKTSNQPMWPMRKIFPLRSPWPGASVTPCRSRRWRSSVGAVDARRARGRR